jgi:hypothetical protein
MLGELESKPSLLGVWGLAKAPHAKSPFEALNGFCYYEHWLRNLLVAASLNGRNTEKFVAHKIARTSHI